MLCDVVLCDVVLIRGECGVKERRETYDKNSDMSNLLSDPI
jgi:hypothetical protein